MIPRTRRSRGGLVSRPGGLVSRPDVGPTGSSRGLHDSGFSLVEVLIALVVLEVGLLGGVGMTLQAQRTLQVAMTIESASQTVEGLADSLVRSGWSGAGSRVMDRGEVRWSRGGSGIVTMTFEGHRDLSLTLGFPMGGGFAP